MASVAMPLHAQTSANVPTNDPAYEWIKVLAGAGLVKSDFPEQLPWSRLEFVRLIKEAESYYSKKFEESEAASESLKHFSKKFRQKFFIHQIMDALKVEFADVMDGQKSFHLEALNRADIQYMALGQSPQSTFSNGLGGTANNGLGSTAGVFHPLYNSPEGRHYFEGNNFDLQTQHWLQLGKYVTIIARPQIEVTIPTTGSTSITIYPKTLAGKLGLKNIEFEVGRDQVAWGFSPHGGMFFSDNSRGLDQVQLSTPYPWHLPWKLRKLGQFKFSTLFSNFGPQDIPSYPWMTATQLVWHVTPNLRFGAGHQFTFGGTGYPIQSAGTLFLEYLGIPTTAGNTYQGGTKTNRSYNLYGSTRIPVLHNTELGFDFYIEDKSFSSAHMMFRYDIAYRGWLWIPDITGSGRWQAMIDYNFIGGVPYRHGEYLSGWSLNSEFLAQTVGPDTQSLRSNLTYLISPYSKVTADFSYIQRLSNTYGNITPPNDPSFLIDHYILTSGPVEHHYLGFLGLQSNLGHGLILNIQAGLDNITNYQFVQGSNRHPGIFKANLSWYPYLRSQ